MPVHSGYDKRVRKPYFQWGNQKKYYYSPYQNQSKIIAYKKAVRRRTSNIN